MKKPYTYQRGIELPRRALDLTGQVFDNLTVLESVRRVGDPGIFWRLRCACGNEHYATTSALTHGYTKSCGCYRKWSLSLRATTHNMSKRQGYPAWLIMCNRCTNPKNARWWNHGGRGIKVCERWLNSFEDFWSDVGPTYGEGAKLCRKDKTGDFTAENCFWRALTRIDTPWGLLTLREASKKFGVSDTSIRRRLNSGWDPVEAMTLKPHEKPTKKTEINLSP